MSKQQSLNLFDKWIEDNNIIRIFPTKNKKSLLDILLKGGSGSGNWEAPGQPRFAFSPSKSEQKNMDTMIKYILRAGRCNVPFQIYSANKNKIDLVNQTVKVMSERAIDNVAFHFFMESKHADGKYVWSGDNMPKKIRNIFIEKAKNELRKETSKRLKDNFSGIRKDSIQKTVDNLVKEAKASFDTSKTVYRGMIIDKKLYGEIKDSIEKKGKYELDVMPISSYTESKKLAIRFSEAGQAGGRSEKNVGHIVFSQEASSNNVLLHSKQKTFKELQSGKNKIKFNIGGYDQQEVILDHKKPKIILTKENISELSFY